ncbi:MAG: hypothetical protein JNL30_17915 [Rubrivivax sp.]|nr:hypothetical protein [Rubrivivax sp.]
MKTLLSILVAQYVLRLFFQDPLSAAASTAFLAVFMAICYRWGGWTSAPSAKRWLLARPFVAPVVTAGVAGVFGLPLFNSPTNIALVVAESVGSYFVFHAFCSVGDKVASRFERIH